MSYNIKISGQIKFEPAVAAPIAAATLGPVQFDGARTSVFASHAVIATAIVPAGLDRPDEDEILAGVEALVAIVNVYSDDDGATFTGYLECQGEEAGDLWRVYVRNGQAVRVDPKIVWPDE